MIYWEEKSHSWWNSIMKDANTECDAINEDIAGQVVLIDENYEKLQLAFLVQRDNEQNNVVVKRLSKKADIRAVKCMYYFMLILLEIYDIEYVSIYGKFNFLRRFWPFALQGKNNVWFCDLSKAKELLNNELEGELYE